MKKRSILIIGNSIRTAMLFRYSLIKELVKRGHSVELVVKYDDKKYQSYFNILNDYKDKYQWLDLSK